MGLLDDISPLARSPQNQCDSLPCLEMLVNPPGLQLDQLFLMYYWAAMHLFNIGPYELFSIETGTFALDGGAMFGVVPKVLWEKKITPDAKNQIPLALRCLLLRGNGKNILIDTGIGHKNNEKFVQMFKVDFSQYSLEKSLAELDLKKSDITDVILTHLHFDHAGGATQLNAQNQVEPTFPNAQYYVQRENWDYAHHACEKDRASYLQENFAVLAEKKQLTLIDGEKEIFPGVKLLRFEGHTSAQQLPLISDGKTTVFFCADLIPTSAHVSLPWIMGYDNYPVTTLEEKRRILQEAAEKKWWLFFEHCPQITMGQIEAGEKGYSIIR